MPARTVEVPALADLDNLPEFAAANHLAHAMLIGIAQPLRSHLDYLLAVADGVARQFRVFQRIRHWLLAVAVLPCSDDLGQQPRMLMITGADHHSVEFAIRQ